MKKGLICIVLLSITLFLAINTAHGNWYGNHSNYYVNPGGTYLNGSANRGTRCVGDGDFSGGSHPTYGEAAVALNNSSSSLSPHGDNELNIAGNGYMRCLKWDASNPTNPTSLSVSSPLCNSVGGKLYCNSNNPTLLYSWSGQDDRGGAGLKDYRLVFQKTTGGGFISDDWHTGTSSSISVSGLNGTYSTHIKARDKALNEGSGYTGGTIIGIDTTTPGTISITATDGRNTNIWRTTSTGINVSTSTSGTVSPRANRYCESTTGNCDPLYSSTQTKPNTSAYTNGTHYIGARSCTAAGNCGPIVRFVIKVDNTRPSNPNLSANDRSDNTWKSDNTTTISTSDDLFPAISTRTTYYCMDGSNSCNPTSTSKPNTSGLPDGIYYYRSKTCTEARNSSGNLICSSISIFVIKIDTTVPTASEFTLDLPTQSYFTAIDSKDLSITPTNDPNISPIVSIATTLERYNAPNSSFSLSFNTSNAFKRLNNNFSNVDLDLVANNYRPYSFFVRNVCDRAGNCADLNIHNLYNVYANDISVTMSTVSGISNLNNGDAVANGSDEILSLSLKDGYGNSIRKVTELGGIVRRDVSTNITYNNSLYLDQYLNTGDSSVFIGTEQLTIGSNLNTPNNGIFVNDADGIYNYNFKLYTSTENSDPQMRGSFSIPPNGIKAAISDFGGSKTFNTPIIDFKFKPMYKTSFTDDGIKKFGFIEGVGQTSVINVGSNSVRAATDKKVYLEFGGIDKAKLTLTAEPSSTPLVSENNGTLSTIFQGNLGFSGNKVLKTLLIQSEIVPDISSHYLSTHISYILDGNNITYNSDIIGKTKYHDTNYNGVNTQIGIRVLGKTYSEKQSNITNTQNSEIETLDGKITKSVLKKQIRSNAYNILKSIRGSISSGSSKELMNGGVIYYKGPIHNSNEDANVIKISDPSFSSYKTGGKTIIVEGVNLVIDENINSIAGGVLGIISLKDQDDKGGNIYIDDDVGTIEATMYTDKSILPYSTYIGHNEVLTQDDGVGYFKNQLRIHGSVFSNNTVGGSRTTPPFCPYFVTVLCDIEEAQKYDLNFLRRYYIYDSNGDGFIVESTQDSDYSLGIHDVDSPANLGRSSVLDNDQSRGYPLIIEYNPLIQTTPPPLFSSQ